MKRDVPIGSDGLPAQPCPRCGKRVGRLSDGSVPVHNVLNSRRRCRREISSTSDVPKKKDP